MEHINLKNLNNFKNSWIIIQRYNLIFFSRRGNHPFITSTYVNGYIKDTLLKNLDVDDILNEDNRVRNPFFIARHFFK